MEEKKLKKIRFTHDGPIYDLTYELESHKHSANDIEIQPLKYIEATNLNSILNEFDILINNKADAGHSHNNYATMTQVNNAISQALSGIAKAEEASF